jgi:diguanylate cyclase (GGDEF)-like protein
VRLARTVADHICLAISNLRLQETLRGQSIRDPLTGLFNRRYLEVSLEREMLRAMRGHNSVGAVMMDIDHFKHFNDTYGHDAGDTLLREVGRCLQEHIRGGDIACRFGGEEFILIFPEASLEDTICRAEAIRETVKHLDVTHRGQHLDSVTLSLGVAAFPEHGDTADGIVHSADEALYRAKRAGRDQVICATY